MILTTDKRMLEPRNIKFLIVHCSDTPDNEFISAKDIHVMHLGFGWNGIGYHKVICRDGNIENGRPEYWKGAHVKNKNQESLGVCLIGRDTFTDKQFSSLEKVLHDWKVKYPLAKILGHNDATITDKTCPNFNVKKWCQERGIS
jgi:N-acetylmuramoyl-L-alanine amidase